MFRILSVLTLAMVLFAGGNAFAADGAERTAVFRVEGMTCGLCAKSIDKALHGLDGVRSVEIDQEVWERNANFWRKTTNVYGGWGYGPGGSIDHELSMTSAGIASLSLCYEAMFGNAVRDLG